MTAGEGKKEILQRVFDHHTANSGQHHTSTGERRPSATGQPSPSDSAASSTDLPCTRVKPIAPGHVYWFADEPALSLVKSWPITAFEEKLNDPKL